MIKRLIMAALIGLVSMSTFAGQMLSMEEENGNIHINLAGFSDPGPFEQYKCNVDFGNWIYTLNASKVTVSGKTFYRCTDMGGLSTNTEYTVFIHLTDWPNGRVWVTGDYTLEAN